MRILLSLGAGLLLFGSVTACGSDDDTTSSTTSAAVASTDSVPAESSTSGPLSTTTTTSPSDVPAEDLAAIYLSRDEYVGAVGRMADEPNVAVTELLVGPRDTETDYGFGTEIPDGTTLNSLVVSGDGLATVDLSSEFESGGGSLSMTMRVAQVVFTLTAFDQIDRVAFLIDGTDVASIGGEGVIVDPPVDRDDFELVRPVIDLTAPLPDEVVTSPLDLAGESATFEATVQYSVVDGDGLEVAAGFFNSEGANGRWGPFAETVTFEGATTGLGAVILWEDDASGEDPDGRSFEVEVPVRIG